MPLKHPLLLLTGAFAPLAVYLPAEAETRPPVLVAQTYPTSEIPCPEGVPPGEIEGETITCGILTVPENYDEPDGRQIDITYAVLHSHSLSPAPDPIIDLRGGPGGTIVGEFMEVRAQLYDSLRRTRDVVLFDQRGTKYSNELLCGPTQFVVTGPLETVLPEEAIEAIGTGLLERFQPMFPEAPVDTIYYYAVMATCAEVLEAHGVQGHRTLFCINCT
jgi:pimeloyl-ACP methyl ester carboxylesterase